MSLKDVATLIIVSITLVVLGVLLFEVTRGFLEISSEVLT